MVKPLRILGSMYVLFGGINIPASATFFTWSIVMGKRTKPALNSPLSTFLTTAFGPYDPGKKSMLLSWRSSTVPKIGAKILVEIM